MTSAPWWAQARGTRLRPAADGHRHRWRTLTIRTAAAAVVAGALFITAGGTTPSRTRQVGNGITAVRQSTDSLLGGCGPVYEKATTPGTAGIIPSVKADGTTPNVPDFGTIVPMTGSFWAPPADPDIRMYTPKSPTIPRPAQLLHNMWNGALVVYYAPDASAADVTALSVGVAARADLNVIVVPWDLTRGPLPSGRQIAFASWGASQTCQHLVVVALNQFRVAHPKAQAPGFGGVRPPQITLPIT